jgi:hypothetical protein
VKKTVWVPALLLVAAVVVFAQERKGKDIADHAGLSRNMHAAMKAAPQSNCVPKGQIQFGQQVSDSVTLTSCISTSGGSTTYTDFWTLNATAGHTIQVEAHSVLIFEATIQDATTGTVLASTNDCGFSSADCTLTYTIPTSGTYLVGFGAINTGSYTLLATDLTAIQPTPSPVTTTTPPPSGCAVLSTQLCLDGHYTVSVHWDTTDGRSGDGTPVPLTANTGYFWFFDPSNVELTIKVLDAHAINGHEWVFYGALSNVHYVITVTDTISGAVRTYENPQGTQASVGDTSAF